MVERCRVRVPEVWTEPCLNAGRINTTGPFVLDQVPVVAEHSYDYRGMARLLIRLPENQVANVVVDSRHAASGYCYRSGPAIAGAMAVPDP